MVVAQRILGIKTVNQKGAEGHRRAAMMVIPQPQKGEESAFWESEVRGSAAMMVIPRRILGNIRCQKQEAQRRHRRGMARGGGIDGQDKVPEWQKIMCRSVMSKHHSSSISRHRCDHYHCTSILCEKILKNFGCQIVN
eukprot:TRINITY_DN18238_c0_g1_i1.p1 TRINITY_DN18238_c0_g1~~TRINITY_DN18238_c0_g1_i1.p1  ORF type:complete len:138 (+),score=17.15 TRINITY_DN18238_c0_g1_i1:3-416(+)